MITLIPIGGTGQRFVEAGFKLPKPFIKLGNDRIIDIAMRSYPAVSKNDKRIYVIRREYETQFDYGAYLISSYTKGPLETIMISGVVSELLQSDDDLLIGDCDSFIDQQELMGILKEFRVGDYDGGVTVRRSDNPAYSYAKLYKGLVERTAEKEVISEWSTTGPYWFKRAKDWALCAIKAYKDGVNSISPTYNYVLGLGGEVKATETLTFEHLGTPKELKAYAVNHGLVVQ